MHPRHPISGLCGGIFNQKEDSRMEQKFSYNSLDLQTLREFCEREGEAVFYRKGDQMEREGDPSRWFGFVTEGCFKYVTHEIGSDREHITWFSFEGEYVGDYPSCLDGRPAQTSIVAMMPSRVLRVTGSQLMQLFRQDMETMELRSIIAEHLLCQPKSCPSRQPSSSSRPFRVKIGLRFIIMQVFGQRFCTFNTPKA